MNVLLKQSSKVDVVSQLITSMHPYLMNLGLKLDERFLAQQISFLMAGSLIIVSIRHLLQQTLRAINTFHTETQGNVNVLFIAQVMGMYFVANALMMHGSIPPEYGAMITEILSGIQFDFYSRWFDLLFVLSTLISSVLLYFISPPEH